MRAFRKRIAPVVDQGRAFWGTEYLEDEVPESAERVREIVEQVFENAEVQGEVDRFIELHGTVDTTQIESIYLDAAVKFYLASPEMQALFRCWHRELPLSGNIVHYGTSSGTESAWLLHQAPERVVLQVDGNDAAFDSGQKKLVRISQGRATDYTTIKREPWRPTMLNLESFADGAIIHRVPPFPLESRTEMLRRAFLELKPGARLVFVEPNLESGGDPARLQEFVTEVGSCSVQSESRMTEFDLALVARVKQRCLTEPGFHMFQAQMTSHFLSYSEMIALAERIGFRIVSSSPALYGRVYQLILEKPAPRELEEGEGSMPTVRVESPRYVTELIPRRAELAHCPEDRERYRRLAVGQMLTSRYGLEQVSLLTADMRNFDEHVVFAARERDRGELAGMARLIPFYETRKFHGLPADVRRSLLQRKTMCMSIYYEGGSRGHKRRECEILAAALACCVQLRDAGILHSVYAEVKEHQERTYARLGVRRLGDSFEVQGWRGTFIPVLFDIDDLEARLATPAAVESWERETGARLRVEFVTDVFRMARGHAPGPATD